MGNLKRVWIFFIAVASLIENTITFGALKEWLWILLPSEGLEYDVFLATVDKS